jgi:hypothetical protein
MRSLEILNQLLRLDNFSFKMYKTRCLEVSLKCCKSTMRSQEKLYLCGGILYSYGSVIGSNLGKVNYFFSCSCHVVILHYTNN